MRAIVRVLVTSVAFLLTIIYALPNLALMLGIAAAVYSEYVSLFFCLVFAYNIARMVELGYERIRNKTDKKTEELHGRGFSYTVEDDKVTFTFRDIPDKDGRQLSRLKFMREKFFKDEE